MSPDTDEWLEPARRWRDSVDQAEGDMRRSLIRQWKEKILEDLVDTLDMVNADETHRLFMIHGGILGNADVFKKELRVIAGGKEGKL
jgi:hypothetical protein